MDERFFHSKILLFGEYSLLIQRRALSIPFRLFKGQLKMGSPSSSAASNQEIRNLFKYIRQLDSSVKNFLALDLDTFEFDLGHGLYFDSSIPIGFGVGSSGALVAALVNKYSLQDPLSMDLHELRERLSLIENYFHESSSGFDPLCCLFNKALMINEHRNSQFVDLQENNSGEGWLFIFDSGTTKKTAPMVNIFKNKLTRPDFSKRMVDEFSYHTDCAIDAFLASDFESLGYAMSEISKFQFKYFSEMIPKTVKDVWKQGMQSGLFHLKLCGAGGGGFFLGHTNDFKVMKKEFPQLPMRKVYCLG